MFLSGRCGAGRGGRYDGRDGAVGRAVAAVGAGATVVARAVVARHVVIAVGPPRSGATGGRDAALRVRVVIDVGAVRRRWRHGSCAKHTRETVNFRTCVCCCCWYKNVSSRAHLFSASFTVRTTFSTKYRNVMYAHNIYIIFFYFLKFLFH